MSYPTGVELTREIKWLDAELRRKETIITKQQALLDRVHAECGPEERHSRYGYVMHPYRFCPQCKENSKSNADSIPHKPNCLWFAVDELRKKAGKT